MNFLLLGIGNLLWADEGYGVRVIEHLQKNYRFPDNVTVMDGGTQGLYLVEPVQQADALVVFDAIDFGLPPGSLHVINDADVPHFLGAKKMSLHQTGFQEVLATAQMLGAYPAHLKLIGVQPEVLEDYGGSLSRCVKAQIQPAIAIALDYLKTFGVIAEANDNAASLADPALDIERYEQERPDSAQACRLGDARVLQSGRFMPKPPQTADDVRAIPVDYRGQYRCA